MRFIIVLLVMIFGLSTYAFAQPKTTSKDEIKIKGRKLKQKKKRHPRSKRTTPQTFRERVRVRTWREFEREYKKLIAIDGIKCAKSDDRKNEFQLKRSKYQCVFRGANADSYLTKIQRKNKCNALEKEHTCPSNTSQYREIGIEELEIQSCALTCVDDEGKREGPSLKVFPAQSFSRHKKNQKKRKMRFVRGAYKANLKTGSWERGLRSCPNCPRIIQTLSNYNDRGKRHGGQWKNHRGKLRKIEVYSEGTLVQKNKYSYRGDLEKQINYVNSIPISMKQIHDDITRRIRTENGYRITIHDNQGRLRKTGQYSPPRVEFQRGTKTGNWKEFHDNGKVRSIRNYDKKGEPDGIYRLYYKTGRLMGSGTYSKGKQIGRWAYFYGDGRPKALANYDKKGFPHGRFCQWNYTGKLVRCFYLKHGTGTMFRYSYAKNKKIVLNSITSLVNNKRHGTETVFRRGKKYTTIQWRDGKKNGLYLQYFVEFVRQRYQDDIRDGESCRSSKSSVWYGDFCLGKKCGTWTYKNRTETRIFHYDGYGRRTLEKSFPTPKNTSFKCPKRIK